MKKFYSVPKTSIMINQCFNLICETAQEVLTKRREEEETELEEEQEFLEFLASTEEQRPLW